MPPLQQWDLSVSALGLNGFEAADADEAEWRSMVERLMIRTTRTTSAQVHCNHLAPSGSVTGPTP